MQEFFKDKSAQVFYDETLDALFLVYTGKVQNDPQFITINTAVLAAFTKLNTQKFVADIRKMGIISVASQNWVVSTLLPGMVKHLNGKMLYHAQLVDPSEILSKVSANNIKGRSSQTSEGLEVLQFSNTEDLNAYLSAVGK